MDKQMKLTRRMFLKDAALVTAMFGLNASFQPRIAEALSDLAHGRAPVLWLQGLACSGCSVSLLNSEAPGPEELLTRYLSLYYHPTLSAATGKQATDVMSQAISRGDYILVTEGAIPLGIKDACRVGDEPFADLFYRAARNARQVIALGTCASFGGVPCAPPNLAEAVPVQDAMLAGNVDKPLINLPGCPAHPDWAVGTLIHLLKIGDLPLDELHRPKRFYGELLHNKCPYYADYVEKKFSRNYGESGCQFKLGCQGVITKSDCPQRRWNGGVNWCVEARGVCVGCAHEEFVKNPNFALYRFHENERDV
jgi:hydrogenase small subunit